MLLQTSVKIPGYNLLNMDSFELGENLPDWGLLDFIRSSFIGSNSNSIDLDSKLPKLPFGGKTF